MTCAGETTWQGFALRRTLPHHLNPPKLGIFQAMQSEDFSGSSAYLVILPEEGGSGNNEVALAVSPVQRWDSGRWFQMPEKWSCTN
jgi:hypothetical protein